jgi:hypothetical protein
MYCIFDTQFNKKKMEFPLFQEKDQSKYTLTIFLFGNQIHHQTKIFSISKLCLEDEPSPQKSKHFKNGQYNVYYVVTHLRFGSKRITPDEPIGKEKRRQKTPYM